MFHEQLSDPSFRKGYMKSEDDFRDELTTDAKQRYCAALKSHNDSKRLPATPAKTAYDKLSARVKSYRSYVSGLDYAYEEASKSGPTRGQTLVQHKDKLRSMGSPMDAEEWSYKTPGELDDATREQLEIEILVAPDGSEWAGFLGEEWGMLSICERRCR